ncbi:MAG: hypothetical protein ACPG32_15905, partial [Akkermansiaceae bacterium]
ACSLLAILGLGTVNADPAGESGGSATAPSGKPRAAKDGRKRLNIRTLCAAYQGSLKEIEIAVSKEERLKFPLYDDAFSPAQSYKGPVPISIYKLGEEKPFATVTPPTATGDVILLFVPMGRKAEAPYRVLAMNGSNKSFPYGMRRMFNFTTSEVALKYGKTVKSIPTGATPKDVLVKPTDVKDERFAIEFFNKKEGKWKRFSATRWSVNPAKRSIVIFYQNPRTNRSTYRSIAEYYVDEELVKQKHARGQKQAEETSEKDKDRIVSEEGKVKPGGKGKTLPPIPLPK